MIVDAYASPTMLSDANEYAKITGDRPFDPTSTLSTCPHLGYTSPNECDAQSWYGEETLDVESVHGQAPDAKVVYVGAASCTDSDLWKGWRSSWRNTWPASSATRGASPTIGRAGPGLQLVFQAGAAEGIGFFFSSGGNVRGPDRRLGLRQAAGRLPGLQPVCHLGRRHQPGHWLVQRLRVRDLMGDSLDPLASSGKSWEYTPPGHYPDCYDGSSGGGVRTAFSQPSYQEGVVP